MQLLLSGAIQGEDGHQGVLAVLLVIDWETGKCLHRTEYMPPNELVSPGQKIQFTGSCFIGNDYYVCTHNEVLVYDQWPARTPARKLSIKGFNDLHHCIPWRGNLAVSNTGLETVDVVSLSGELLERHDLLKGVPEARVINDATDYRLIADTKPHKRHGNHLFELNGELWTGQLTTSDAVCATDTRKRLEMGVGMPHDGTHINGHLIFTTTNGHLVFFNPANTAERRAYNLVDMTPGLEQLGWCRGVTGHSPIGRPPLPGTEDRYIVGFSALRRSKWKEFGYWIKYGHSMPKSHLAEYDLKAGTMLRKIEVGENQGYQIFQIDVLPPERCI